MAREEERGTYLMSDCINCVEAAYDLVPGTDAWLRSIGEAARPWLDRGLGVIVMGYDVSDVRAPVFEPPVLLGCPDSYAVHVAKAREAYGPDDIERALGSGPLVTTVYDGCEGDTSDPVYMAFKSAAPPGVSDYLTINARAPDRTGVIVGAPLDRLTHLDPADARLMTRVGVHFTAGYRLRSALAGVTLGEVVDHAEAVLTPGGKVEHATGPAQSLAARRALQERALAIDRARSKRGGRSEDALALWKGLVSGRWSLVDRFDSDGRRYVVALKNDPDVTDPRALTLRERQIGGLAGMGYSNKLIAYALGLSPSNVSATLRGVLRKLGLRHRTELAMLSAAGSRPPVAEPPEP